MTHPQIPLCKPSLTEEDISAVSEVLRSGWLAHGEYNKKLEEAFCSLVGVPHAIAMNSCTSALEIALKASGIKGEVIVPSMTWVASANAVITSGATPVFCEVDPVTRNVTAETIAPHISLSTEAVMVVHFGGQPCAMDGIIDLCQRHGLLLIEDSAETIGATWKGAQAGSFGIGCFSFFPTKNITTGEGGILTCKDDKLADKARALIAHGISSTTFEREKQSRPWFRAAIMPGHNYRMPNPLAVLGYRQMKRLDSLNEKRIALARRYDKAFMDLAPVLRSPKVAEGANHVYQMYTVELTNGNRDQTVLALRDKGIGASVHFDPPVHLQPVYLDRGCSEGMLPVTETLASQLITLPIYPDMTTSDQDRVIQCVREITDTTSVD